MDGRPTVASQLFSHVETGNIHGRLSWIPASQSGPSLPAQSSPQTVGLLTRVWHQLSQLLLTHNTAPGSILHQIPELIGQALNTDLCWLIIHHPQRCLIQAAVWHRDSIAEIFHGSTLRFPSQLQSVEAFLAQHPLLAVSDLEAPPHAQTAIAQDLKHLLNQGSMVPHTPVKACMAIALPVAPAYRISLITARSHSTLWQEADLEMAQAIGNPIAVIMTQVLAQQRLQRQTQHQRLLHQFTQSLSTATDCETVLNSALAELGAILGASRGQAFFVKYSQPLLQPEAADLSQARVELACEWSSSTRREPEDSLPLDCSPSIFISQDVSRCPFVQTALHVAPLTLSLNQGQICLNCSPVNQARALSLQQAIYQQIKAEAQSSTVFDIQTFPALLIAPIMAQDKILGLLVLQDHHYRCWDEDEHALVEMMAAQLGAAFLQIQTLQQVQSLVHERTVQLQRSLEVQSKLYEQTRKQIDQLRHLNQLKDEFVSTVSHELLTPLTSMRLATRMLRQSNLSPERQDRYLSILEQQCTQETELISDLLTLQRLEAKGTTIQLQNIELGHTIQDWTQAWSDLWQSKQLQLQVDLPTRSLPLQTDPDSLRRILRELCTNASKYAQPSSKVHLQVSFPEVSTSNGHLVIALSNIGTGIAPEELPHIFDKFRRGRGITAQAVQGTGLGLTLVKYLVQHLNGSITASSRPLPKAGVWETCFTLKLPQFYANLETGCS